MIRNLLNRVIERIDPSEADRFRPLWSYLRKERDAIDFETPEDLFEAVHGLVEVWKAKATSYRDVIETVLRERNEWRERFETSLSGHATAQHMLQRTIIAERSKTRVLARRLQALVDETEFAVIAEAVSKLNDPPIGTAEEYEKNMAKLVENIGNELDAVAKRDQIDASA